MRSNDWKPLPKSEIERLRSLRKRQEGAHSYDIYVEGPKLVEEAFRFPNRISAVYASDPTHLIDTPPLAGKFIVSEKQGRVITSMDAFPGVACLVEMYRPSNLKSDESAIYLHQVQDPGNVGTIIRLAHWYGVSKLLLSPGCASPFNQKVVQASMGSIFSIDVIPDASIEAMASGQSTYVCDLEGTPIEEAKFKSPWILCLGNESQGFASLSLADFQHITIPRIHEKINSLNVAIACGIVLDRIRTGKSKE